MLFGEPIDTISERKPKVETKKPELVISKADEPTEAPQLTEPVVSDERTGPPVFNFKVTVDENGVFVLDGDVAPFLRFSTKCKYVFDQSHESNAGKRILFGRENGQSQYFSDKIINSKAPPGTPYSNVTINMGDSIDLSYLYYYWKGGPDSGNAIGIISHSTIRGSGIPPKLWVSLVGMLYLFSVNQNRNAFLSLIGKYDSGNNNNSKSIKQRKKEIYSGLTTANSGITSGYNDYAPKVQFEIRGNTISVSQNSYLLTQREEFLSVEYLKENPSQLYKIYLSEQYKKPVEVSKKVYDAIKYKIDECKIPNPFLCYVKIRASYYEESQFQSIKEYYGWKAVPLVKKETKDPSKFTIKLQGIEYSSDSYIDMYPINFKNIVKISELSDIELMYVHYISNTYGINLDEIIKETIEELDDVDYLTSAGTFVEFVTGEKGRKIPSSVFQVRFADLTYLGTRWIDLDPLKRFNPDIKGGKKQLHDLNPIELNTIEHLIETGDLYVEDIIENNLSDFDDKQNTIVLDAQMLVDAIVLKSDPFPQSLLDGITLDGQPVDASMQEALNKITLEGETSSQALKVETVETSTQIPAIFTLGGKEYPGNYYIDMSPITGGGIKQLQNLSIDEQTALLNAINNEGLNVDPLIKPNSSELANSTVEVSSVGEKVITSGEGDVYLEKHVSDMLIDINGKTYSGSDFIDMRAITGGGITKLGSVTPVEHAYIKYSVMKLGLNLPALLSSDYDSLSKNEVNSEHALKVNNTLDETYNAPKMVEINGMLYPGDWYINTAVINSDEGVKMLFELTSEQIQAIENADNLDLHQVIQQNISFYDTVTSDGYRYPANCDVAIPMIMLTDTQVDHYMIGKEGGAEILSVRAQTKQDFDKYFEFPKPFELTTEDLMAGLVLAKGFGRRTKEDEFYNSLVAEKIPDGEMTLEEQAQKIPYEVETEMVEPIREIPFDIVGSEDLVEKIPDGEMTLEEQAQKIQYGVETEMVEPIREIPFDIVGSEDLVEKIPDGEMTLEEQAQKIPDGDGVETEMLEPTSWKVGSDEPIPNLVKQAALEEQFKFVIKPLLESIYYQRIFGEGEDYVEDLEELEDLEEAYVRPLFDGIEDKFGKRMKTGLILKKTKSGGSPLNVKMKPDGGALYEVPDLINEATDKPMPEYAVPVALEQRGVPPDLPPRAYRDAVYEAMNVSKPKIGGIRTEMLRPMRAAVGAIDSGLNQSTSATFGGQPVDIVGTPSTRQNPPALVLQDPVTGAPLVPVGGNRVSLENPITGGDLVVEKWRRLNAANEEEEEELPPVPGEGTANSGSNSIYDSPRPVTEALLNSKPPNPKPGRASGQPKRVTLSATIGGACARGGAKGLSKALAIRLKEQCEGIQEQVTLVEMTGEELQRYVDFAIKCSERLNFMGYDAARLAIEFAIEHQFEVPSPEGDMDIGMIDDISIKIGIEQYIGKDVLSSEEINELTKGFNEVLSNLNLGNVEIQMVRNGLTNGIEVYAEQNPEFKAVLNKGKLDISQLVDHVVVTSLVKNEIRGFTNTLEQVTKLFSDPQEISTKEQYKEEVVNRFGKEMAEVFDNLQTQYKKSPKDAFSDITGSIAEAIQKTNETFIQGASGGVEGGYEVVFRKELADAFNSKIGLPGSVETPVAMDKVILQKFTNASVEVVEKINSITLSKQSYDTAINKIISEEASIMASYVKETPYIQKMKEYGLTEKEAHERLIQDLSKASEQVTLDMMNGLHNGTLSGVSAEIIDPELKEKFEKRIEANLNSSLNEQYENRKAELQKERTVAERENEEAARETGTEFFEFV